MLSVHQFCNYVIRFRMSALRMKVVMPIFAGLCPESVSIATFLQRSGEEVKKVSLIMLTHMCTCPENLVKIGPSYSETIGLIGLQKLSKQ